MSTEPRPQGQPGPDSTVVVQSLSEKAGDTIGRYKLPEKIGEGGWGAVYVYTELHRFIGTPAYMSPEQAEMIRNANELALDIQRHLRHEPIIGRPPRTAYRFQKLIRRNKLAFTTATGAVVALVVGLAVAAIGLVRERSARVRAVSAEREQSCLREEAV